MPASSLSLGGLSRCPPPGSLPEARLTHSRSWAAAPGRGKPRSLLTQGAVAAAASAQERTRGAQPRVQRTQRPPRPARPLPPPRATASLPLERGNSHLASGSFSPPSSEGRGRLGTDAHDSVFTVESRWRACDWYKNINFSVISFKKIFFSMNYEGKPMKSAKSMHIS